MGTRTILAVINWCWTGRRTRRRVPTLPPLLLQAAALLGFEVERLRVGLALPGVRLVPRTILAVINWCF